MVQAVLAWHQASLQQEQQIRVAAEVAAELMVLGVWVLAVLAVQEL